MARLVGLLDLPRGGLVGEELLQAGLFGEDPAEVLNLGCGRPGLV